jgi:hypothetical protein
MPGNTGVRIGIRGIHGTARWPFIDRLMDRASTVDSPQWTDGAGLWAEAGESDDGPLPLGTVTYCAVLQFGMTLTVLGSAGVS